jgi:hypothetical protein
MKRSVVFVILAACSHPVAPVAPVTPAADVEAIAKACSAAEYRQLDFWVGEWTVKVHARATPTSDQWADSIGTQHVHPVLSGCAIQENFSSAAPNQFAGKSFSAYVAPQKKWRQTWVDDSGGYLAFTGGPEDGSAMTLYGEPRSTEGKEVQMRMVYSNPTPTSLHWEWQRTDDSWATHALMISIEYTRR